MSRLRFRISMSLDGYVAGPDQSVKEPLGVGGERLHNWVVSLAERLFDRTGDDLHGLALVRTVATPRVVHLKLERGSGGA